MSKSKSIQKLENSTLRRSLHSFWRSCRGLDVIDLIAAQQTGQADRPVEDIKMKIKIIK